MENKTYFYLGFSIDQRYFSIDFFSSFFISFFFFFFERVIIRLIHQSVFGVSKD